MSTLLRLGEIAGLAGISLGVLLLLFRGLLQKVVLAAFTKQQSFRIVTTFMVLVWLAALSGIGAWVYASNRVGTGGKPDEAAVAQGLIKDLQAKGFEKVFARFSDGFKPMLPPHKIEEAWKVVREQLGEPVSISKPVKTTLNGQDAYILTYAGTKANASVYIGFDAEGKVNLLWFDWR